MYEVRFALTVPQEINPNGVQIRTAGTQDKPLFCLKDVCDVLEIDQPVKIANRMDEDEVTQSHLIDSMGRQQLAYFVTEAGLYTVLLRSDKPNAKPFRKWVCGEVLPSIRKHGSYPPPSSEVGVPVAPADLAASMAQLAAINANVQRLVENSQCAEQSRFDPREAVLRCWPEVSNRRLQDIVGKIDELYRKHYDRPAPRDGAGPNARIMCFGRDVNLFLLAFSYYWRRDHPPEQPQLYSDN